MPDIALRFNKDMLVLEGGMGTMLQRQGMPPGECPEHLNVLDPEIVTEIHRYYNLAGAQCAITNTFGGTRAKLSEYGLGERVAELNRAGVRAAKAVQPQHVLADVGPCGLVMQPLGTATFDEAFSQYREQIEALAAEEPDAILIETMVDIADARCAVLAARAVCDLPVFVSCTFNDKGRMDLSGTDPATAAIILEGVGASVVGMNCGLGPEQMIPLLEQMAAATALPLLIQPNAGLPTLNAKGETVYPGTPDQMAAAAQRFRKIGAQFIGSCCGSTPAFTGAIYAEIGDGDVQPRTPPVTEGNMVLASPRRTVTVGQGEPTRILGERINPTGKPDLTAELRQGRMSIVRAFAEEQEQAGADLLDVNVGAPQVDAVVALPLVVQALTGLTSCPLVLDTTDYHALEAALKIYPGRALINSTNGEATSFERVLPLAKQYGAGVVVLALDETGIPKTVEGRLAIMERVRTAAHSHGLRDSDLLIDVLVMTAAAEPSAPAVTLEGVHAVSAEGLATLLGVSNVSHGLPDRPTLNAAFAGAAVAAGLSIAIINPNDTVVPHAIRLANAARGQVSFHDAWTNWQAAYETVSRKAASGAELLATGGGSAAADSARIKLSDGDGLTPEEELKRAILRGDADGTPVLVDAVIADGVKADTIVDTLLTPTIQKLGDAFGRGEAFLPQMMVAADAMKAAVTQVKTHLPATEASAVAGRIVFCTVKGDVHSIGKDICIALLESQGFLVCDLGVDVEPSLVLAAVREFDADVVCLSALMTTTLAAMRETTELIHSAEPDKAVLVGGAVVTPEWAQLIDAGYSSDAPDCVEAVRRAVKEVTCGRRA